MKTLVLSVVFLGSTSAFAQIPLSIKGVEKVTKIECSTVINYKTEASDNHTIERTAHRTTERTTYQLFSETRDKRTTKQMMSVSSEGFVSSYNVVEDKISDTETRGRLENLAYWRQEANTKKWVRQFDLSDEFDNNGIGKVSGSVAIRETWEDKKIDDARTLSTDFFVGMNGKPLPQDVKSSIRSEITKAKVSDKVEIEVTRMIDFWDDTITSEVRTCVRTDITE